MTGHIARLHWFRVGGLRHAARERWFVERSRGPVGNRDRAHSGAELRRLRDGDRTPVLSMQGRLCGMSARERTPRAVLMPSSAASNG